MSEEVRGIVDDLRESAAQTYEELSQVTIDVLNRAADALEAAQQAPAVDRGQLANALGVALANAYDDDSVVTVEESVAVQLFASGILQDAAVVRSEGYDEGWKDACEEFYPYRAQQVREGNK